MKSNEFIISESETFKDKETELKRVIEEIYNIFSFYNIDSKAEKDITKYWKTNVLSKNLRDLSSDDLHWYHLKAMTSYGDVNVFRYFLPRLLELLALQSDYESLSVGISCETMCSQLNYANWLEWNATEKDIIIEYVKSLWCCILTRSIKIYDLHNDSSQIWKHYLYSDCAIDWIFDFSIILKDLSSLLSMWIEDKTLNSSIHLSQSILKYFSFDGSRITLKDDNKRLNSDQISQINDWISNDRIVMKIEEEFSKAKDDAILEILMETLSLLRTGE